MRLITTFRSAPGRKQLPPEPRPVFRYEEETDGYAWHPHEPDWLDRGRPDCFCCGTAMELLPAMIRTWWCPDCEVTEARLTIPQPPLPAKTRWNGRVLAYIDHGAVHAPSPG